METFVEAAAADLAVRAAAYVAYAVYVVFALVFAGVGAVLGILMFGRNHKKRIAALEARLEVRPAISQTFNFASGATPEERDRHILAAVDAATTSGIREAIERLPRTPLAGGHAYVSLPEGTKIVLMSDGTMRLALPVKVSDHFRGEISGALTMKPRVVKGKGGDD